MGTLEKDVRNKLESCALGSIKTPCGTLCTIARLPSGGPAQGREHHGKKTPFMKETPEVLGEVSSVDENQEGREEYKINRYCLPRKASQAAPVVKNPPANTGDTRDTGPIPGWEKSSVGGHGSPLQHSCLEDPRGQRRPAGYGPQGHKEWTRLSDTCTHTFLRKGKRALIQQVAN